MKRTLKEASGAYKGGNYTEAARLFEDHIAVAPEDWRARLWYARALSECSRTEEALTELKHVMQVRPESPLPYAFSAIVLFDAGDFRSASDIWETKSTTRTCAFGESIAFLARFRNHENTEFHCSRHIKNGNADIQGRFLHYAETKSHGIPDLVLRDFMDEIGIGWPKYRFPPPWLLQNRTSLRRIWRLMGRDRTDDAFEEAERVSAERELNETTIPTLVAAAIMAGRWNRAYEWALGMPRFSSFIKGESSHSGLRLYQMALSCGMLLLMTGKTGMSRSYLRTAIDGDSSSYIPFYALGLAGVRLDTPDEARRSFVAACDRVNPHLATDRWKHVFRPRT